MSDDEKKAAMGVAENGAPLDDESLEQVSGGFIHRNGSMYEVLDEDGDVVGTFSHYMEADRYASDMGMSTETIDDEELSELRRSGRL